MMRILKAGGLYFALVFAAGFLLGTFRVLWFVPSMGQRAAELFEAPLMLVVTVFAARWVVRRMALPCKTALRLGMGLVALGLMIAMELTVVLALRGVTLGDYLAGRDPVAGTVYVFMLAVFALMPLFVSRR